MILDESKISTRDQILDATGLLMGRFGFRKMTMDDVAKEAGVGKRTIYLHFASKEDVGLSFLRRLVEAIQEELAEIIASDLQPAAKLSAVLTRRIVRRVVGLNDYEQCLDELFESARTRYIEQRKGFFLTECQMVVQVLEEGRLSGAFAYEDGPACAKALLLATNTLLPYSLSVKEMGGLETIECDLKVIVDLVVAGLSRTVD
jgi:AcrR family transcriptional regulator